MGNRMCHPIIIASLSLSLLRVHHYATISQPPINKPYTPNPLNLILAALVIVVLVLDPPLRVVAHRHVVRPDEGAVPRLYIVVWCI